MVYVTYPEGILWRANADGSNPLQLTSAPVYPKSLRWSPDGQQILFVHRTPQGANAIYTIDANGGTPRRVLPNDIENETDPSWSADGKKIVYSTCPTIGASSRFRSAHPRSGHREPNGSVPANTSRPANVQPNVIQVQATLTHPGPTQNTVTVTTSQPVRNVIAAKLAETETSVATANIPQPVFVQPNVIPAQTPLTQPATIQDAVIGEGSQPTQNLAATPLSEAQVNIAQASIAPASIPQAAVAPSQIIAVQTPLAEAATTQDIPNAVVSQPTHSLIAVELPETGTSVPPASIAPASISQPTRTQSNLIAVQTPLAEAATTQDISTAAESQPTRNITATGRNEAEQSLAPASVQSSVTPPSNDPSRSSSNLPPAPMQDIEAPITTSVKSGNADPIAAAAVVPDAASTANSAEAPDSLPEVAASALSGAVQTAVAKDLAEQNPVPVLRGALIASVKDVIAPALADGSAVQANPLPAVSDQSPATLTASVPGGIAEQLAALPPSAGPLAANQIAVSNLKPVFAAKPQTTDSSNDKDSGAVQTGTKKNAEPATAVESKTASKDAATSGNQSQGGNTSQTQATTPIPVNFAIHPAAVIAAAQNAVHVATGRTSSTPADAAGVAAKTADNAAHAAAVLPQASPVINTAKLIQSMGQSVMRVGMRSDEFGNISISTSASKDTVSAQISLDHGELAKILAAHLPEMQTRLGVNQPMDVHIDMNGAATGQGTGTFGGMSNGSADSSRNSRQQTGNMAASHAGSKAEEQQFSPVATVMPAGYARLDIRV